MKVAPSLAMVAVECSNVVSNILFKAASLKGLGYYIFVAYCYLLATFVFIPLFFFRKTLFPPLSFPLISRLCLVGIIGYGSVHIHTYKLCKTNDLSDHGCFRDRFVGTIFSYKGIELSFPTLASAISNLIPAFTFILAVFFRMEKLELRRAATQAKIIGTIASISGALVMTFYKGPKIISSLPWTTPSSLSVLELQRPVDSSQTNWILGGILGAVAYLLFSFWYIIQAQVMKIYPEEIVVTFFYNLAVALLSLPVCFIAEPELSSWRLTPSISVVAVLYSGLFAFSFTTTVHTWAVRLKGPVFVAIFRPTSIVIAAVMSAIFLGEAIYLGSVIGAVVLIIGIYAVLWGTTKEEEMRHDECGLNRSRPSSSGAVPLLRSYTS